MRLVCDVRSCDLSIDNEQEIDDKIRRDMLAQQRWHDIIKPIKSMLKFRFEEFQQAPHTK